MDMKLTRISALPPLASLLLALSLQAPAFAVAPVTSSGCGANSSPVGTFQILVQRPDGAKLPIRSVQVLNKDYKILYKPVNLPADIKKEARVTIVYMESGSDASMTVTDMNAATSPAEWTLPTRTRVVVFAFGPQGLDEKKVTNLVTKDKRLISQISQYADQTSQTEDNLELLSLMETDDDDPTVELLRTNPTDRMLAALVRTLSGTNYGLDATGARRAPLVSMKDKAMDGFFANAGGLFPGAGMLPEVKGWIWPETDFRSVFSVPISDDSMQLCGRFLPALSSTSRSKTVYLWAHKFSDASTPVIELATAANIPVSAKTLLPLKPGADPLLVEKIRDWSLKPMGQGAPIPVRVNVQGRAIEIDPRIAKLTPGSYQLTGRWDFESVKVAGSINAYDVDNLATAKPAAVSLEDLVTNSGPVRIDFEDADFQFVKQAALRRSGGQRVLTDVLDWQPPVTFQGPQRKLSFELDTDHLRPGNYVLTLTSVNGANRELPISVAPAPPQIENLPIHLALDTGEQQVLLKGRGLDRIEGILSEGVKLRLADYDPTHPNQRLAIAKLQPEVKTGAQLAINLMAHGNVRLAAALQVGGPKPKIVSVKVGMPDHLGITPNADELPAGSFVSVVMKIEPATTSPAVKLQCAENELVIKIGEKKNEAKLESVGPGQLFLSFDPGTLGPTGCKVTAILLGDAPSDPVRLGQVIRFPRIEMFWMTDEKAGTAGNFTGILTGSDLELIDRTGWDATKGVPVDSIPSTAASSGTQQTLKIAMPWPSPTPRAPIYVWLRGESQGRLVESGRPK